MPSHIPYYGAKSYAQCGNDIKHGFASSFNYGLNNSIIFSN